MHRIFKLLIAIPTLSLLLNACGGGGGSLSSGSHFAIALSFERLDTATPNPFRVTATVTEDGQAKSGIAADITITLDKGARDNVTEVAPGQYQFTVTPTLTGEYPVTVSYRSANISRTALVLAEVASGWGQPMAVEGLVNTAGYEDGVTISPDGEYLFVQYGPWYFSALPLFEAPRANGGCEGNRLEYPLGTANRCTHPWLDNVIGPYTAPERPGFFDGRISVDGTTNLHNANSWGVNVDQSPIFAPSTMLYGFKRQNDGSFAEPFYFAFDDVNDAIINPSGLSLLLHGDNTATILFAFDDPSDPDLVDLNGDGSLLVESLHDVYTAEVTLGQNNLLGRFVPSGTPSTPPVRDSFFPAQLVDFGKTGIDGIAGTQGNPHLYDDNGVVKSIWTDDERDAPGAGSDRGDLAVYLLTAGSFPNGSWSKLLLPDVVNQAWPSAEIQPFFTGSGLYFTRSGDVHGPEVFYASYSGSHSQADLQNAANWDTPQKILGTGTMFSNGEIAAIGEPTVASRNGSEYLYFVYALIRGQDTTSGLADIDMQAGYIKKN